MKQPSGTLITWQEEMLKLCLNHLFCPMFEVGEAKALP